MNDVKKFMIGSMHRTGHHAIAVWLLHQIEGIYYFDINSITPWLFYLYNNQEQVRYLANNPLKVPMLSDGKSYQLFGSDGKGNHGLSVEHPDKVHFDKIMKDYHEANSNTNLIIGTHEQKKLKDVAWGKGFKRIYFVASALWIGGFGMMLFSDPPDQSMVPVALVLILAPIPVYFFIKWIFGGFKK